MESDAENYTPDQEVDWERYADHEIFDIMLSGFNYLRGEQQISFIIELSKRIGINEVLLQLQDIEEEDIRPYEGRDDKEEY